MQIYHNEFSNDDNSISCDFLFLNLAIASHFQATFLSRLWIEITQLWIYISHQQVNSSELQLFIVQLLVDVTHFLLSFPIFKPQQYKHMRQGVNKEFIA